MSGTRWLNSSNTHLDRLWACCNDHVQTSAAWVLTGAGAVYAERSGVFNIGLEGMMLVGAFFAVAASAATDSLPLAVLAALAAGSSWR